MFQFGAVPVFQFQYGAVKREQATKLQGEIIDYFNSSMVRLKVRKEIADADIDLSFQFQYGAVKSS